MIDRSYLPYKSAREYQDRKMAKWMGFFLSEHTTALQNPQEKIDLSYALSLEQSFLLLQQLYMNGLEADFSVLIKEELLQLRGRVIQLSDFTATIRSQADSYILSIKQIIAIKLSEEEDYEY